LEAAYNVVRDTVAEGGMVLFVGTKRQAQETVQSEAIRSGMPYVTNRWLGGMLTNWRTIRGRINEMERLERMRDRGDFERITKKEAMLHNREIERLEALLGGIRSLAKLPNAIFVIDVRREETAIHEANLLNIPVIALVDTNCDPKNVDYVVPSNDDAIRAIKLLVGKMADAALEGRAMRKEEDLETAVAAVAEEQELSDEELLGEATLAKLTARTTYISSDDDLIEYEGFESEVMEETESEAEEEEAIELDEIEEEFEEFEKSDIEASEGDDEEEE
jgi:small subunit ribosomal protein S2